MAKTKLPKQKPIYCAVDTETTGLNPLKLAVLQTSITLLDEKKEFVCSKTWNTIPSRTDFTWTLDVEPYAMKVNKINLDEHIKTAMTYEEVGKELDAFFKPWKLGFKTYRLKLFGHNVKFDHTNVQFLVWDEFKEHVMHKGLDSAILAEELVDMGKLPAGIKTSLEDLGKHLGVDPSLLEGLHDAEADVKLTIAVHSKLRELLLAS